MAFITPTDVAPGNVLTAARYNQDVVENTKQLRVPPMCIVARTSSQTGYASQANIAWSSALVDTDATGTPMWSAGDSGKVYARVAGLYLVQMQAHFSANATVSFAGTLLRKNAGVIGESFLPIFSPGAFPEIKGNIALVVDLDAGDSVSGAVTIAGGSSYIVRGAATTTDSQTRLAVTWIGAKS